MRFNLWRQDRDWYWGIGSTYCTTPSLSTKLTRVALGSASCCPACNSGERQPSSLEWLSWLGTSLVASFLSEGVVIFGMRSFWVYVSELKWWVWYLAMNGILWYLWLVVSCCLVTLYWELCTWILIESSVHGFSHLSTTFALYGKHDRTMLCSIRHHAVTTVSAQNPYGFVTARWCRIPDSLLQNLLSWRRMDWINESEGLNSARCLKTPIQSDVIRWWNRE